MPLPRHATGPLAAALRLSPSAALRLALVAAPLLALAASPALALLVIDIDKSTQTMTVARDGAVPHRWPVSTGMRRHDTPAGRYTPFRLEEDHFSREWDDAPMPHSIFFTRRGHAIHGTTHLDAIGRPASHGCVRLEPENARRLFDMVRRAGLQNVRVVLHGQTPSANAPWLSRRVPSEPAPPAFDGTFGRRAPFDRAPPWERGGRDFGGPFERERPPGPRTGYWVEYPDGSRVFVDSEQDRRALPPPDPPPSFFGGQRLF